MLPENGEHFDRQDTLNRNRQMLLVLFAVAMARRSHRASRRKADLNFQDILTLMQRDDEEDGELANWKAIMQLLDSNQREDDEDAENFELARKIVEESEKDEKDERQGWSKWKRSKAEKPEITTAATQKEKGETKRPKESAQTEQATQDAPKPPTKTKKDAQKQHRGTKAPKTKDRTETGSVKQQQATPQPKQKQATQAPKKAQVVQDPAPTQAPEGKEAVQEPEKEQATPEPEKEQTPQKAEKEEETVQEPEGPKTTLDEKSATKRQKKRAPRRGARLQHRRVVGRKAVTRSPSKRGAHSHGLQKFAERVSEAEALVRKMAEGIVPKEQIEKAVKRRLAKLGTDAAEGKPRQLYQQILEDVTKLSTYLKLVVMATVPKEDLISVAVKQQ